VKKESRFTDRELDIMSVLWALASGTVAEVRQNLADGSGYTTVLKMLQILEEKGLVRHEREGRAYRYHPAIGQGEAGKHELLRIVDKVFQGSTELAVAKLVHQSTMSAGAIRRVRALLDRAAPVSAED